MRTRIQGLILTLALVSATSCSRDSVPNTLAPGTEAARLATDISAASTITLPFDANNFKSGAPNVFFPLARAVGIADPRHPCTPRYPGYD
jgi:hypothetical protein